MQARTWNFAIATVIIVPALCAVGAAVGHSGGPPSHAVHKQASAVPTLKKVASSTSWHIDTGPDPFALPRRPKSDPPTTIPLRKTYNVGTTFLGHTAKHTTDQPWRPPHMTEATDNVDRMAGFLSGNGVYAVLETPDRSMVVNPGDRLDDGRVVNDIRPTSMHLGDDKTNYLVTMRSSLQ